MHNTTLLQDLPKETIFIVGGGVIGLSIAWRLAQADRSVALLERDTCGAGASHVAAGMLAPLAEVDFVEKDLLTFKRDSLARYPEFIAELETAAQMSVDYRQEGTLVVAIDRDDAEDLRHLFEYQRALGLPVEWLTGEQARGIEPYLSPNIQAAVDVASDHQIDNLKLLQALERAAIAAGASIITGTKVTQILHSGTRVRGLVVQSNAHPEPIQLDCQTVVIAAGCWSRQIEGLGAAKPPVRPVKGQILGVQMTPEPVLRRVVRAPDCYMVPRSDGRLIIGATSEEKGFDTQLTAGGLFSLLRGAYETLPVVYELPVVYTQVGLRPGSLDNAPILGHTQTPGLVFATGHYRNGILLTPATADLVTEAILTGTNPEALRPFDPCRF